jgi:NADH dehydrogenase FAD-containing subunit
MARGDKEHRVVIVGAGFAGFNAARELSRLVGSTTEIVVINSTDYFLYLPLMPQVTGGLVEPAHIRVSLLDRLRKIRFVLGTVNHVDPSPNAKVVSWAGPEGSAGQVRYDRLILTAGSVNKLLPIPGVADYAVGFRTIAEAAYLRDHIIRQLELAAVATDPAERAARCTFVVVGAGYTGTEVTAHGQLMTSRVARRLPGLAGQEIRWMLLVARNVAASLGTGTARPYKHRDLGFLVDLGGLAGAANPLHVPVSGLTANAITRGYHLAAMSGNRLRVLTDWTLNGITHPESTSLEMISAESVPLDVEKPHT